MKAIELVGDIDDQHRLHAQVPNELPAGQVRLIVLLPEEDATGGGWAHGIADEWSAELKDTRQDIYTLDDGRPVNEPGECASYWSPVLRIPSTQRDLNQVSRLSGQAARSV